MVDYIDQGLPHAENSGVEWLLYSEGHLAAPNAPDDPCVRVFVQNTGSCTPTSVLQGIIFHTKPV